MSTYWGYHCKTCPQFPDGDIVPEDAIVSLSPTWDNHGDDRLRALAQCLPEIKALHDKLTATVHAAGWLEFKWLGCYEYPDPITWLLAHVGHDIELHNEYGEAEPIERGAAP
jgi:hypothetical protein